MTDAPGQSFFVEAVEGLILACFSGSSYRAIYLERPVFEPEVRSAVAQLLASYPAGANLRWKVVGIASEIDEALKVLKDSSQSIEKVISVDRSTQVILVPSLGRLRLAEAQRRKVKVLILDDSRTACDILTKIFSMDSEMEIHGIAHNTAEAEALIAKSPPDVMTVDLNIPGESGTEFLRRIGKTHSIPSVIISAINPDQSDTVLAAIEAGAVDYIKKPEFSELSEFGPLIVEKVKGASKATLGSSSDRTHRSRLAGTESLHLDQGYVIAIAASTGGTQALRSLFTRLPANIPPILVVQHIPPIFSAALAHRLDRVTAFNVKEAEQGDEVIPGRALIAPGDRQMKLVRTKDGLRIEINQDPPVNRHRPSADYLFESVAQQMRHRAVGIVLTGMGSDGARGLLAMREKGARTIAQDEASSIVYGMPREAARIGAVERIAPLSEIPEILTLWLNRKAVA